MTHKVALLSTDDWIGLYLNGKLQTENHSLSNYDWQMILKSLNIDFEWREVEPADFQKWGGRCPDDWKDVSD